MISTTLLLLRSRRVVTFVLVVSMLAALSYAVRGGIALSLDFARPKIVLPYSEVLSIIAAYGGALLMGPRFWEWDMTGTSRAQVLSAVSSGLACVGPLVVIVGVDLAVPAEYATAWRYSNALVLASLVMILSPLISPSFAFAVVLAGYIGLGLVRGLWGDLAWVPITADPSERTDFVVGVVLTAGAVAVNAWLRGSSRWAWRLFLREH